MWVRGLKLEQTTLKDTLKVAPYVGAWIETTSTPSTIVALTVAPYVGAWIETSNMSKETEPSKSHPMWVRGLKHIRQIFTNILTYVAPYVGAWIETLGLVLPFENDPSHPMWVRGLKHCR